MTLDEKIGQLIMIGFRGTELKNTSPILHSIKKYHIGGVWLTDDKSPMGETVGNIRSADQIKKLIEDLQSESATPLFVTIDAEGGKVIRLQEEYGFPKTKSAHELGKSQNIEDVTQNSALIAKMIKELGFNFNFAPVVDLGVNPENIPLYKKERCYSPKTNDTIRFAKSFIKEHRDRGVLTLIKHFPGHGSSQDDTHCNLVDVTNTWNEKELIPYKTLLKNGMVDAVLTAHIINRNLDEQFPATLSKKIINGLLRTELGFNGVVISDDMNMGAIVRNYNYCEAVRLSIEAGLDIILNANVLQYDERISEITFNCIKNMVIDGTINEERIDKSVKRIMELKKSIM